MKKISFLSIFILGFLAQFTLTAKSQTIDAMDNCIISTVQAQSRSENLVFARDIMTSCACRVNKAAMGLQPDVCEPVRTLKEKEAKGVWFWQK